jgi:hypothetical protein
LDTTRCFIDSPFSTTWSSVSTSSFLEQREDTLDPAIHRAAVNDETTLSKLLDHIGVPQAIPNVPVTARAITSPGKAWWEKALVERDVKRRPHTLQRQHCPPSRVCPSLRIRSLPHRMHFMASAFSSSCADYLHHPHRIVYAAMRTLSPPRGPATQNPSQPQP